MNEVVFCDCCLFCEIAAIFCVIAANFPPLIISNCVIMVKHLYGSTYCNRMWRDVIYCWRRLVLMLRKETKKNRKLWDRSGPSTCEGTEIGTGKLHQSTSGGRQSGFSRNDGKTFNPSKNRISRFFLDFFILFRRWWFFHSLSRPNTSYQDRRPTIWHANKMKPSRLCYSISMSLSTKKTHEHISFYKFLLL